MLLGDTATPVGGPTLRLPYRDRLRPLSPTEFFEFRDDIARHGIRQPIVVNQNGDLIDGHNRLRVALSLGIHWDRIPRIEVRLNTDDEVEDFIRSANVHRRHLTAEEVEESRARRNARIQQRIHQDGASTRQVAAEMGVDQATVVRAAQDDAHASSCAAKPSNKRKPNAAKGEEVRQRIQALQAEGATVADMSDKTGLSPRTVQHHLKLLKKPRTGDVSPSKKAMVKRREEEKRQAEEFRRQTRELERQRAGESAVEQAEPVSADLEEISAVLLDLDSRLRSASEPALKVLSPIAAAIAKVRARCWPAPPNG